VWIQRIHAELFQHGVAIPEGEIRSGQTRAWLAGDGVPLSAAARHRITAGYRMIDATDAEILTLQTRPRPRTGQSRLTLRRPSVALRPKRS
jgi:hypothetical protein